MMKTVNETFTDAEYEQFVAVKGARTWRDTILEGFDVQREAEVRAPSNASGGSTCESRGRGPTRI